MADMVARPGFNFAERRSARERRRQIIESAPVRIEVDAEGREWRVRCLPDPGEPVTNGKHEPPRRKSPADDLQPRWTYPVVGRYVGPRAGDAT